VTDAARAAAQERATLEGLTEAAARRAVESTPPAASPLQPTTVAGLPIPADLGRKRAEWKASGMSNDEIEDLTAEMLGQPVPVREGPIQYAPRAPMVDFDAKAIWGRDVSEPEPIEMTDDELARAVRDVREAKARVVAAADALEKATAEQTAALDAHDAAKRRVAAGMAALTR
jgi:hypothetical protein